MTKFFALTLLTTYGFWSAFNPQSGLNFELYKFPQLPKFDCNQKSHYMGPDQLCQSLIYMTMFYYRYHYLALFFMGTDLLYYGPMTLGGSIAPIVAALTLL